MVRAKPTARRVFSWAATQHALRNQARNPGGTNQTRGVIGRAQGPSPGATALREIRRYQAWTNLVIPRAAFDRLVRETTQSQENADFRFERETLSALQDAVETYLVEILDLANLCAIHCGRQTISDNDIKLIIQIKMKH